MFILFGSPRSGTTLFKESLNLHSGIFIPNQTTFISPVAHVMGCISDWSVARPLITKIIQSTNDFAEVLEPYISVAEIDDALHEAEPTLAGVLISIYRRIASNAGKQFGGDKTPDDLLSIRKLEEVGLLDSDIRFLHIVRDVRGAMLSLKNVTWAPSGIEEYFPRLWNYTNLHLNNAMRGRANYLLIRYEDLVSNPRDVLARSTAFLGLPFEESMLDHSKRAPVLRNDQSHLNLSLPFLNDRATAWQSSLPPDIAAHCCATAAEGLKAFGYV
ncbi:sulfotransferase [Burkholderia cenocepacia]|uniref:Sulfotransferase n=1 Tax=Burkholderia cenocepacia TaxID=95486 RepID=A0A6J5JSH5_9BURK|nr:MULTISPECIES: sulfotransferase [Burkholderia cepacia complex]CAB3974469.1 sulfotransferase [Burkholderia cenocepacia]